MDPPKPYLVTGVEGGTYPRLEIRDLEAHYPEQFTLFILGWKKIRQPDHTPLASQFVQIGGIHGLPYETWPGDPEGAPGVHSKEIGYEDPWHGYCSHESVRFPTWHRPLVMLLEQSISEAAQKIAEGFAQLYPEEGEKWKKAAKELRFPYWDWTDPRTGKEGLPRILQQEKLNLTLPQGAKSQVDNILAFFEFDTPRPKGFGEPTQQNDILPQDCDKVTSYFDKWERTYRWPKMVPDSPTENITMIDKVLMGQTNDLGSWLQLTNAAASTFNFGPGDKIPKEIRANAWDRFSNILYQSEPKSEPKSGTVPIPPWKHAGDIEDPHNLVHLVLGGTGGHMMDNGYASFDPIFFLHHANVDRLLAFWEHVYPQVYMGEDGYYKPDGSRASFTEALGTWSLKDGQDIKGSTALTPFRKGDGCYWTSDDTRWGSKSDKHYTYPSIPDPDAPGDPKRAADLNNPKDLERQRAVLQKHFRFNPVKSRQDEYSWSGHAGLFSEFQADPDKGYEKVHEYRHFVVNVYADSYVLGCSYAVNIRYELKDAGIYHIGCASVLARSSQDKCAGCQYHRAVGGKSGHVIVIPHHDVVKILSHWRGEHPGEEITNSGEIIRNALRAEISLPGGTPLARLDPSSGPNREDIPKKFIPDISLASASVEAKHDPERPHDPDRPQDKSPLTPYETYDWKDHGELPGGWVKSV